MGRRPVQSLSACTRVHFTLLTQTDRQIEGDTDGLFKMLRRVAKAPKSFNNTRNVGIKQH